MTEPYPPPTCPSCDCRLVARVYGPWCPRCRDWIVLRQLPRWEDDVLRAHYEWTVSGVR